jgi:hypothetical protein
VVAGNVQQRDVETADEVFKVIERQVPASEHQVRPQGGQLFAVETLLDLVGDGEDTQLGLVVGGGGPQRMPGIGGRSQGDDEHARERIA